MSASGIVEEARNWLRGTALPVWLDRGIDKRRGGFVERLHMDGEPDAEAVRRLRVQARQIYVLCHAAHLGWSGEAEAAALSGFDYLVSKGWRRGGEPGWVHLLEPSGAVADARRDAYDHAFVLLACAWAYRISGDSQILGVARETLDYLDTAMGAPNGGWLEGHPHTGPRRQNPHMHMLEAFLALYEATEDPAWLERASKIHTLFETHFLCPDSGRLTEYFNDDWSPANGACADRYEPGHHMEWVWLLGRYGVLTGADVQAQAAALYEYAASHGRDRASGFLWDEISAAGALKQPTRRCWPQTELLKAHLARAESGQDGAAREMAEAALAGLMEHYIAPAPRGGWIDRFDAKGAPAAEHVPASTLYHLFCAIAEADRVLGPGES